MQSGLISCFHEVDDKLPYSKIAVELAVSMTVVAVRWGNITEVSVPSPCYQSSLGTGTAAVGIESCHRFLPLTGCVSGAFYQTPRAPFARIEG